MILLKRFFVIVLLAMLFASVVINLSFATDPGDWDGTISDGANDAIDPTKSFISNVLGVVRTVGMIIAVVILVVIACKYMLAAPSDRADLKKYLQIYVIGALVLFGAAGLVGMVRDIVNDSLVND